MVPLICFQSGSSGSASFDYRLLHCQNRRPKFQRYGLQANLSSLSNTVPPGVIDKGIITREEYEQKRAAISAGL
jgi:hypothetical protein